MLKLFGFFSFFLLSFLSPIFADDITPGDKYRTTDTVKTLSGATIDNGAVVEALAISDVPDIVSPSGQLLTFKYQNRIFNADFDGFEQALSKYQIRHVNTNQDVAGADVCFDVFHLDMSISLPPLGSDNALEMTNQSSSGGGDDSVSVSKSDFEAMQKQMQSMQDAIKILNAAPSQTAIAIQGDHHKHTIANISSTC